METGEFAAGREGLSTYLTIAKSGQAEIEVRRSRFNCTLERVETEADAREVVGRLRRAHPGARHHCSAFVLGAGSEIQRSSDDGEPSGTAGAPMLQVLRGHEVSDVVAVVTRWFGGVLLGTGGLSRAYGDAVVAALEQVGIRRRELIQEVTLSLDHASAGRVESELRTRGLTVLGAEYAATAVLRLGVRPDQRALLDGAVAELTAGTGKPVLGHTRWVDQA